MKFRTPWNRRGRAGLPPGVLGGISWQLRCSQVWLDFVSPGQVCQGERYAQRPLHSFASTAWLRVTPPSPRFCPQLSRPALRRLRDAAAAASPSFLRASPAAPRALGWAGAGRPCSGARCVPEPRAAAGEGSACLAAPAPPAERDPGGRSFLRLKSSASGARPGRGRRRGGRAHGEARGGGAGAASLGAGRAAGRISAGAASSRRARRWAARGGRGAAAFPSWAVPGGASGQPSASPPGGRWVRPARLPAGARTGRARFRVAPAALPAEGSSSARAANCGRAPLGPLPPPESVRSPKDAAM